MSTTKRMPVSTALRLAQPAGPGNRHQQVVEIATSLIGSGYEPAEVHALIRPNYGPDLTNSEIGPVIDWAVREISPRSVSSPSGWSPVRSNTVYRSKTEFSNANDPVKTGFKPPKPETAVYRFLNGFECEEADLWESSAIRLTDPFETDSLLLVSTLFEPGELVNIVTQFRVSGEKANPVGYGETETREKWIERFANGGFSAGKAGAWIRPNPMDGNGIKDQNVTAYRFLLVESDEIPFSLQIPFLAKLGLPISAIISSGGKSLHAWVRIDAMGETEFRETAKAIFERLSFFGIDSANRNPSRLSRFPSVIREIGKGEDNRQRLLFLNPDPKGRIL